jgi:hypothetical protein
MGRLAALCLGFLLSGAAPSSWQFTLPAGFDYYGVGIASDAVVVSGQPGLLALDARTGRLLWRRMGAFTQPLIDGASVIVGSSDGAIRKRQLRNGAQVWESPYICEGSKRLFFAYDKIAVGCSGGTVALVDRSSGALLRLSNEFQTSVVQNIRTLGSCSLHVSGYSSGAALRNEDEIVNCEDLHTVWQGIDTSVLGSIGDIAIIDDWCCNGRPEEYRPATIYRVDLKSGHESSHLDLRPEQERYPPNSRPIGQGSGAFLFGNELYVNVDNTLYAYGDPRDNPKSPRVVTRDLSSLFAIPGGLAYYETQPRPNIYRAALGTLSGATFRPLWSINRSLYRTTYDQTVAPDYLFAQNGINQTIIVGLRDHKRREAPCRLLAAANSLAISKCTSDVLVNNSYLQVLTATPI